MFISLDVFLIFNTKMCLSVSLIFSSSIRTYLIIVINISLNKYFRFREFSPLTYLNSISVLFVLIYAEREPQKPWCIYFSLTGFQILQLFSIYLLISFTNTYTFKTLLIVLTLFLFIFTYFLSDFLFTSTCHLTMHFLWEINYYFL